MSEERRAYLIIEDAHGFRRTVELGPEPCTIGRRSQHTVSFPSESTVSRNHATIVLEEGNFILCDQESTFGTYVNDQQIKNQTLVNGDEIRFGKCHTTKIFFNEESKIFYFSSENFELMKKILQISKALNSSLVLDQVLQMVLDAVLVVTLAERGFIMLKGEDGAFHHEIARNTRKDTLSTTDFQISDSVIDEVQKTGRSLIIRDIKDYSWLETKDSIIALELRSIMCVPLKVIHFTSASAGETLIFSDTDSRGTVLSYDEIIGLVYVDNRVSNKSFTQIDLDILEALCSHAAISIYNSRLILDLAKSEKLSTTLVDASKMLNSTLDLNELLKIIIELATRNLDAAKSTLYLLDIDKEIMRAQTIEGGQITESHHPLDRGVAGEVVSKGQIINLKDQASVQSFLSTTNRADDQTISSLLCLPLKDKLGRIIGAIETINKTEGPFDIEDEKMLEALSIHASLAIENAMLLKEVLEKRKLEQELEVAAEIQGTLLPEHAPTIDQYDIHALTVQCKQVGGDYYDFIPLDENRWGITVADIAGKGIPAALLMSNLQATLQARAQVDFGPAAVITATNHLIFLNSTANKYATVFYGVLDSQQRTFSFTNAGHNPPILRRSDGEWQELSCGGMVVGLFDKQHYEQNTLELKPGDIVLLFTDGASEAMNIDNEEFGLERLKSTLEAHKDQTAVQICSQLYQAVEDFEKGMDRHDDLTLLVLKVL
ncbi:SpoIIE family protein phosphatase [bacterium]|nr:SpoIIE family protein phosphatase [bacterium]